MENELQQLSQKWNAFAETKRLEINGEKEQKVLNNFLAFMQQHDHILVKILCGKENGPWKKQDVREYEEIILEYCEEEEARDYLRLLRRAALAWSSKMRCVVELPRIPIARFEYSNPFADGFISHLQQYNQAKDMLSHLLRNLPKEEPNQNDILNVVVLSSILHGGLFCRASVVALLRSISEMRDRTMVANGRLYVTLQLSWRGYGKSELRRWEPDDLTAVLWTRLSRDAAQQYVAPVVHEGMEKPASDGQIYTRFKKQFRFSKNLQGSMRKYSLDSILRASSVVAHTQMPSIIVGYARRESVSHSISAGCFERFHKVRIAHKEIFASSDENLTVTREKVIRHRHADDPVWLQNLLSAIESPSAQLEIESLLQSCSERVAKNFADFALWLRSVSPSYGGKPSTKSMVQTVGVLGQYLAPFLEDVDPATADSESMSELYYQAMEATGPTSVNQKAKGVLSRALREYDRYLTEFRLIYAKAKSPWFPSGLADIDANPVSHDDYERLLNNIEKNWPEGKSDTRTIAWLLVVLGFRCGLRHKEALYLQVEDVLVLGHGELILRPTILRPLKSENSERRIPLGVFLSREELEKMREWKRQRISHPSITATSCLFGLEQGGGLPVSEKIFDQIHLFMREDGQTRVDKDHFHQLRHGFATWTFLALMLSDLPEIPVLFPQLPKTTEWLSRSKELRAALFRHTYSSRKYAYMVARLLGHSSPGTSLENYVHCADLLLSMFLEQSEMMRPDSNLIGPSSGCPDSTWRSWIQNGGARSVATHIWQDKIRRFTKEEKNTNHLKKSISKKAYRRGWIEDGWEYLHRIEFGDELPEDLRERFHYDEETASALRMRAQYLSELRLSLSHFRHEVEQKPLNSTTQDNAQRTVCPRKPRGWDPERYGFVIDAMVRMYANAESRSTMQQALQYYVCNVNREHFVCFRDLSCIREASRWIYFLSQLKIKRSSLRFVSGNALPESTESKEWESALFMKAESRPKGGDFGAKSALHIGLRREPEDHRFAHAAYRFIFLMGYIVFGTALVPMKTP